MYTFDEVEAILYKQAYKFSSKREHSKFEIDELVNEVWLRGSIHNLKSIKYVSARAYFDMIDYARTQNGRKGTDKYEFNQFTNLHDICSNNSDTLEQDYFHMVESKNNHVEDIDNEEQIRFLLSKIPSRNRELLLMYYFNGMALKEIAKEMNLSEARVCTLKKESVDEMKLALEESESKHLEEILPEYVSDYEIGNECALGDGCEVYNRSEETD